MVVVTGQSKGSGDPDEAMSSSDAEDDFQEPATPTATQAGQALPLLPQQVRAAPCPAPGVAAPAAQCHEPASLLGCQRTSSWVWSQALELQRVSRVLLM